MRLFCQEKTTSPSENWQFTVEKAVGEFACVLGADDVFEPNHLERKVDLFQKFPNSPFVHGAVQIIDENGDKVKIYEQNLSHEEPRAAFLRRMLPGNSVVAPVVMFRLREAKQKKIGFNSRYTILMDWYFWMELALNFSGTILYDDSITMKYRMHPQNISNLQMKSFRWLMETVDLQLQVVQQYANQFRQLGINPEAEQKIVTERLWALAFQQFRKGNRAEAKQVWQLYRQYHHIGEMFYNMPVHYWKRWRKRD
ncbi:MAG TPA: hypothetical protein VN516_03280 [Candidatus Baltobacteraceae bacterium]|nr:hypothetical protein [Candidatus Baltobacteraceae bacterium]